MKPKGKHRASRRWSGTLSVLAVVAMVAGLLAAPGTAGADPEDGQSVNVVIIGGSTLDTGDCTGSGTEANNMGATAGGCLPVTGLSGELGDFAFSAMEPSAVTTTNLANFDTAVLNMASTAMACNTGNLSAQAKSDLLAFVQDGHKLIIYDSECSSGVDYSWMPYPFTTANPGALGGRGTLTIIEQNLLSTSSAGPHYIDAAHLGSAIDAVGDMNVMTTYNSNWCLDMSGTNAIGETGPVHTYAKTGVDVGLIIYNGLDQDYQGYGINDAVLRKMWVQELQQPFNPSNLPCGVTVVGITLAPATAQNMVGEDHTVTATLTDLLGNLQPDIEVTFEVTSGPNAGDTGTDTTDTNGEAFFTYTGDGGVGTDQIEACFINADVEVCSQTVTKEWLNTPPVADPDGPYLFPLAAGPFDGSESYDPDGDALTYAWTFGDAGTGTGETPSHTYTAAGIYDVCLTVNDGLVDSAEVCTTAVIYDPDAGFVTGGGWIDSPAGAFHPSDLPFFDGSYYDVVSGSFTWAEANAAANASELEGCDSAHLATITSQEEQDAIHESFGNHIAFAWLGAHLEAGEWQWVTGEPWDYTNWQPGEPSGNAGENALHVGGGGTPTPEGWIYDGRWNDTFDDWGYPYVVEYDGCVTGKATFGFVSKYKKGAKVPTGNTEFQFKAGDLNFHSTSYQWLVVTGSNFAKFKGVGTINGAGEYKFQIWAGDSSPDTFRIKIWDEDGGAEVVVYDNGMNQPIGGGSIVIHTKKK